MDQPDFRALCAELLAATQLYTGLNPAASEMSSVEKTKKLMDAMAATVAELATPPPEPLRPIPVSERLPELGDANEENEVWVGEPCRVYQSQNTGEIEWAPRRFTLRRLDQYDAKNECTWLPYNAFPNPEAKP